MIDVLKSRGIAIPAAAIGLVGGVILTNTFNNDNESRDISRYSINPAVPQPRVSISVNQDVDKPISITPDGQVTGIEVVTPSYIDDVSYFGYTITVDCMTLDNSGVQDDLWVGGGPKTHDNVVYGSLECADQKVTIQEVPAVLNAFEEQF